MASPNGSIRILETIFASKVIIATKSFNLGQIFSLERISASLYKLGQKTKTIIMVAHLVILGSFEVKDSG